ncbi:hypothetical protein VTO42DRAFT_564 [Malbranchea cinnamomea]
MRGRAQLKVQLWTASQYFVLRCVETFSKPGILKLTCIKIRIAPHAARIYQTLISTWTATLTAKRMAAALSSAAPATSKSTPFSARL